MTTGTAYGTTNVDVSKSQDEIRRMLKAHGAQQFTMAEGRDYAGVEFIHGGVMVRMKCPLREITEADARDWAVKNHAKRSTGVEQVQEQEARRVWRVLFWSLKARLVAVEEGLETLEQAFLAHMVDPSTNTTLWEAVKPAIEAGAFQLGGGGLKALGRG